MDDLLQQLNQRIDQLSEEIAILKITNQSQDTQLQAANTALEALKVAQQNRQAVKNLAEDFKDVTQITSARMASTERALMAAWRMIRILITAFCGYFLLQRSADLWANTIAGDDKLADWLSIASLGCVGWVAVIMSGKEHKAFELIQSLPFFRK